VLLPVVIVVLPVVVHMVVVGGIVGGIRMCVSSMADDGKKPLNALD
jgi:hypothetical protein